MAHVICLPHRLYLPLGNILRVVVSVPSGENDGEAASSASYLPDRGCRG